MRRAAGEDRLSHAVILTGRGDLTAAARFLAAAHVCEGADSAAVRLRLLEAVSAVTGLSTDRITVVKMRS